MLTASIAVLAGCKESKKVEKRTIYNEEFKWTIEIPAGFDTVSGPKWAQMQQRGLEAIEKTYDMEVENNAKTIFVFHSDMMNYFESNVQPFDTTASDEDYRETCKQVNEMMYGTFQSQMPEAQLDSSSSVATVSGLEFQAFRLSVKMDDNLIMKCQMFSRRFGNKEFSVNMMTANEAKEGELMKAWKGSKFAE